MKTHQEGNTIESDLSFIFIGFLTLGISPTLRGKAQRGEHMSSAQIDVAKRNWTHTWKSQKKSHTWTHIEKTHEHTTKETTHRKGMKTHQEGNAIESDLYFSFIGCLTFLDVSHKQRQSAKRREHMSSAQIDVAKRNWTHIERLTNLFFFLLAVTLILVFWTRSDHKPSRFAWFWRSCV